MAHPAHSSASSDDDIGLKIPGHKFWIEIDGKRAKQYQVEQRDSVVSCYIASEVNKEFAIVTQRDPGDFIAISYYLHDDCINSWLFKPESRRVTHALSHVRTQYGNQKFAFSSINFAEEDQVGLSSQAIPKNLGTIKIELYHIKNINGPGQPAVYKLGAVSTMSEKSKSIGFHTVSLRPPEIATNLCSTTNVTYVDPLKPWFTIKFFYRPLDVLRAQGIASGLEPQTNPGGASEHQDNHDRNLPTVTPKTESTEDRKPLITKAYRTQKTQVMKTIETVIIDSDSEDNERSKVKTEKGSGSKRSRESSSKGSVRHKRHKTDIKQDPDVIVLDSD